MLVAFISSSSPLPGGSSSSTTATPPSTLRTAFMVLLFDPIHYHGGHDAHTWRWIWTAWWISSTARVMRDGHSAVKADPACVPDEELPVKSRLEFWVFLPQMRLTMEQLVVRARAAEAAGFGGV